MNRLGENKSGLQTKTEGNTQTIRGKQRNNKNIELQQKQTPSNIETDLVYDLV